MCEFYDSLDTPELCSLVSGDQSGPLSPWSNPYEETKNATGPTSTNWSTQVLLVNHQIVWPLNQRLFPCWFGSYQCNRWIRHLFWSAPLAWLTIEKRRHLANPKVQKLVLGSLPWLSGQKNPYQFFVCVSTLPTSWVPGITIWRDNHHHQGLILSWLAAIIQVASISGVQWLLSPLGRVQIYHLKFNRL